MAWIHDPEGLSRADTARLARVALANPLTAEQAVAYDRKMAEADNADSLAMLAAVLPHELEAERARHIRVREFKQASVARALAEQESLPIRRRKASESARRGRERQATGRYTAQDLSTIYSAQNGLCFYCHVALEGSYHAEHKIPLARGGTNHPENIACACATCNLRKGILTAIQFAEKLSREIRLS